LHFQHYSAIADVCDEVISRPNLLSLRSEQLADKLLRLQQVRRKSQDDIYPIAFAADLHTRAICDSVTEDSLKALIRLVNAQPAPSQVTAFGGGLSGAHVLRVERASTEASPASSFVVKVSNDATSLRREVVSTPAVGTLLASSATRPASSTVASLGEWHAYSQPLFLDAHPFADWILSRQAEDTAYSRVAKAVVGAHIGDPAAHGTILAKGHRLELRSSFRHEVIAQLELLRASGDDNVKNAIDGITGFLVRDGLIDLGRSCPFWALQHGDLHARNILVNERDQYTLIDFARTGYYPRCTDAAALLVDAAIMVGRRDRSPCDPTSQVQTFQLLASISEARGISAAAGAPRFDELSGLVRARVALLPNISRAEWSESLLFQGLRYLRFSSLAPASAAALVVWSRGLLDLTSYANS
jgi:hypothetical protein